MALQAGNFGIFCAYSAFSHKLDVDNYAFGAKSQNIHQNLLKITATHYKYLKENDKKRRICKQKFAFSAFLFEIFTCEVNILLCDFELLAREIIEDGFARFIEAEAQAVGVECLIFIALGSVVTVDAVLSVAD